MPNAEELLAMDEDKLIAMTANTVAGREQDTYRLVLSMRWAKKNQKNAEDSSSLTGELVAQTTVLAVQTTMLAAQTATLATQTRKLVIATWVLAGITFLTLIASIYFDNRENHSLPAYGLSQYYEH